MVLANRFDAHGDALNYLESEKLPEQTVSGMSPHMNIRESLPRTCRKRTAGGAQHEPQVIPRELELLRQDVHTTTDEDCIAEDFSATLNANCVAVQKLTDNLHVLSPLRFRCRTEPEAPPTSISLSPSCIVTFFFPPYHVFLIFVTVPEGAPFSFSQIP